MDNTEDIIGRADAETVVRYLIAALKRVGEIGIEAAEAYQRAAEENAGNEEFEEGLLQINA